MGPVQLPPEVQEVVRILKNKIQSAPMLVFPDFDKPCLLETDASKEGLGAVLSKKQDDRCYHPVTFGSHSLTPTEKNYHSLKLEFLALKWSVMEHFKEYLVYAPFVVRTDNNPLTYIFTTPNLDATRLWMCPQISLYLFLRVSSAEMRKLASSESYFSRCEKITSLASFHALLAFSRSLHRVNSHCSACWVAVTTP